MNVLIINSKFPPDSGVGTFRVAKFAKYLSKIGCDVHVLTMENCGEKSYSLMQDIECVESITRTDVMTSIPPFVTKRELRWIKPMINNARGLIQEKNIDVVLHSVPDHLLPIGCHWIRKKSEVAYILDLRDPISKYHESFRKPPNTLKEKAYRKLTDLVEPRAIDCSTDIIVVSDRMNQLYRSTYPSAENQIHTIHNGYDEDDFKDIIPITHDKFTIVFPGKFRDDMRWFFEPFAKFASDKSDVKLIHFGDDSREEARQVKTVIKNLGIRDFVSFEGYVEREIVFRTCKGADLGLVASPPSYQLAIQSKTYDYIGSNLPILGVDDGASALRDILQDFPNAKMAERSDSSSVYGVLEYFYENRPEGLGNPEKAKEYSREYTTDQLYQIMKSKTDPESGSQAYKKK